MEVKELQDKIVEFVKAWDKKRNFTSNEQNTFNHLVEEVGELAKEYVNQDQRPEHYNVKEVENAIGDIFLMIVKLAHLNDLDIEKVVLKIMKDEQKLLDE